MIASFKHDPISVSFHLKYLRAEIKFLSFTSALPIVPVISPSPRSGGLPIGLRCKNNAIPHGCERFPSRVSFHQEISPKPEIVKGKGFSKTSHKPSLKKKTAILMNPSDILRNTAQVSCFVDLICRHQFVNLRWRDRPVMGA